MLDDAHQAELAHRVNYAARIGDHEQVRGQLDLLTGEEVPR